MKNLDTEAMNTAIREVLSFCGVYVLTDANKFQAAILDFMPDILLKTEQQLLIFSIRIGIGNILIKAIKHSASDRKRAIATADNLLTLEFGFQKSRSNSILRAFAAALDWNDVTLPNFSSSENIDTNSESEETLAKGTIISFGSYKWRVLFAKGGRAMLLADEITDIGIPYNLGFSAVSWETCSLRQWLNTEFYERFTTAEKNQIINSRLPALDNQWYQTSAGNQTEDKVFLLSISEAIQNFGDSNHILYRPKNSWTYENSQIGLSYAIDDEYNNARRASYKGENTWWWLRSPGDLESKAAYVNADGIIFLNGESAFDDGGTSCIGVRPGVRPSIYLQL